MKSSIKSTIRYSESFKQQVVDSIESGEHSLSSARSHFGITGGATIQKWIKKKGKLHLLGKIIRVETPKDQTKLKSLEQEIAQLKAALIKSQIEGVVGDAYLTVACRELGINVDEFKKKENQKPTSRP